MRNRSQESYSLKIALSVIDDLEKTIRGLQIKMKSLNNENTRLDRETK